MRWSGNLKDKLISFENIYAAFIKAFRGSKNYEAYKFSHNLDREILSLQSELVRGAYMPGKYRYMYVKIPKEREVAIAPFRDRVVHHAIFNILSEIYEKQFIFDSWATRKDKGTHQAVLRAQCFLRENNWYLKMDIRKYFASINHEVLVSILKRKIKDCFVIDLCEKIIRMGGDGIGLPIGNLTSQFFANVYLDVFDHFVKERLRLKYYLRYMDDFCFFSGEKNDLKILRQVIEEYLHTVLKLKLKESATLINSRTHGLGFLGVRIWPNLIRVRRENFNRSFKKLKTREWELRQGYIQYERFQNSMNSLVSHINYWGNNLLKQKMQNKLLGGSLL